MVYYLLFHAIILGSCLATLKHANENDCFDESRNYLHYIEPTIQENLLVYNSFLGGSFTCSSISNFAHFNDLILDCNQKYNITKCVAIWPKNPLIIDEKFLFNKIFTQNQIDSMSILNIGNIKGIDISSKPFNLPSRRFKQRINLCIFFSKLNVYSNSILIESNKCDLETFNMSNNFAQYIFSIGFQMVEYPKIWCPFFFLNFDLSRLHFFEITNNFLISNR